MSKVKVSPGLISGETSLPALQMTMMLLCSHVAFSLCVCTPGTFPSSFLDTSSIELGSHPIDLIYS